MSHLFDSGFSVREPAWHGLTNVLAESPESFQEARKAAGLDKWEVEEGPVLGYEYMMPAGTKVYDPRAVALDDDSKRKLATTVGNAIRKGEIMQALTAMGAVIIEDKKRTLRSDSGLTLGVPGQDYEVINIEEIGRICEALTKAMSSGKKPAKVTWEALVSLEKGKSIVATLYLDEPVKLPNDPSRVLPLLVVSARNDGAGAARAQTGSIRVICANTRSAADYQADQNNTVFTFRHGANWEDRLDEAVQTLKGVRQRFSIEMEFARELARIPVTQEQTKEWLGRFFPYPESATKTASKREMLNIDERRLTVMNILESDTCKGIRGKAYGLVAAGDEWLQYYQGLNADGKVRNPEAQVKRQLLVPQKMALRNVQIVREVVGLPA